MKTILTQNKGSHELPGVMMTEDNSEVGSLKESKREWKKFI